MANENNLGCSPKVYEAIKEHKDNFSLYPDYRCTDLITALSRKIGSKKTEILVSNGSFEMIALIARAFLNKKTESITSNPSFFWYSVVSNQNESKNIQIPLEDNFRIDLNKIINKINDRTKIIWLCNPNNPTGDMFNESEIILFLKKIPTNVLVVLDEAYIDFARKENRFDTYKLINKFSNLISVRTFSKLYGLASLRIGYAIANDKIIEKLNKIKQPFNVNYIAQIAATASLKDKKFEKKILENNAQGLELYYHFLSNKKLNYVRSNTNFIFFETGKNSDLIVSKLFEKGILVRGGKEFGFPTYLRISIGKPEENERVIRALNSIL